MDEKAWEDGNLVANVNKAREGALNHDMLAHSPKTCLHVRGRIIC
jgi:hypothetical protein